MKKWIHAKTEIDNETIQEARKFAERFKGSIFDEAEHYILIPFSKGATEEELMSDLGLGKWFQDNGFDIEFHKGDAEYTTKPTWMNYRGWTQSKGHTAMLRDRLIMEARW